RVLVWFNEERKPELVGTLAPAEAPEDRATFLAFGKWLAPRCAAQIERAIAGLREERRTFNLIIQTNRGVYLEAQGRAVANHVAVRFLSLSETRREHAEMQLEQRRLRDENGLLFGLLDTLRMPAWL